MAILTVARENVRQVEGFDLNRAVLALLDRVETWFDRHDQRTSLSELTEHQLKDVGLSTADVAREAAKPFWQA